MFWLFGAIVIGGLILWGVAIVEKDVARGRKRFYGQLSDRG